MDRRMQKIRRMWMWKQRRMNEPEVFSRIDLKMKIFSSLVSKFY